jgi:hypothetical protein
VGNWLISTPIFAITGFSEVWKRGRFSLSQNFSKKVAHSLEFTRNSSACAFLFDGMETYGALVGCGERQGARSCAPVKTTISWLGRYIKARGGLMA